MPNDPLNFDNVEALRKQMLLTVTQMAKALTVSRVTYSGWVEGKPIRKGNDIKVREILRRMLTMVLDGWPNPITVEMSSADRFTATMDSLHPPEIETEADAHQLEGEGFTVEDTEPEMALSADDSPIATGGASFMVEGDFEPE